MKYGYCLDIKFLDGDVESRAIFEGVAKAGFDYVELPLNMLSECTKIAELKKELADAKLPCLACNLFFPFSMKLVGKDRDKKSIESYLARMIPFAAELGVETLVFGNGGARRVPPDVKRETAWDDLRYVVELMEKYAGDNKLKIAVEPLNTTETNIINSYTEGVELTKGLTHVATMIDSYHVLMDNQTYDDVLLYPDRLWHIHTAYSRERFITSPGDDLKAFDDLVKAIHTTGYDNKISLEGKCKTEDLTKNGFEVQIKDSLNTLIKIFGGKIL
jgi:sugar phosphate isomerase/epimerase